MIRRILVPLDGSGLAEGVLPHVEEFAKRLHAKVHLVRVLEISVQEILASGMRGMPSVKAMVKAEQAERKEAENYLSCVADRLREQDIDTLGSSGGQAADKIVELAHAGKADLVSMSTHGRSGLSRVVSGSVAEEVLRSVALPVLLITPEAGQNRHEIKAGKHSAD